MIAVNKKTFIRELLNMAKQNQAVETQVIESDEDPLLVVEKEGELTVNPNCRTLISVMNLSTFKRLQAEVKELDPNSVGIPITATYKEFAQKESIVGIFVGISSITPQLKEDKIDELTGEIIPKGTKTMVRTIQWMGTDGKLYQNGGVALVGEFVVDEKIRIPIGSKVKITHTEKKGYCKLFNVELL